MVSGSRDWEDPVPIYFRLSLLVEEEPEIIHGACRGADNLADKAAHNLGYHREARPAEWDKYGKAAGFKRNIEMLEEFPDLLIAFQSKKSRGTQHAIDEARKRGIPVEVYTEVR